MIRVAVCDDDKFICDSIKEHILKYSIKRNEEFETMTFKSCEELMSNYLKGDSFDLIFLDIEFTKGGLSDEQNMNGIAFGRKLRRLFDSDETAIIYVTSFKEYAIDAIKTHPFDWLGKPFEYTDVEEKLDAYVEESTSKNKMFEFVSERVVHHILVSSIRYFKSDGRRIIIHTSDSTFSFNGSMSDIVNNECLKDFVSIHKSFYVNINYISRFTSDSVILIGEDEEKLDISKSKRKEVSGILMRR